VITASFYQNLLSLDNLIFENDMIVWAGDGEAPYFEDGSKFQREAFHSSLS
jgi:hypothetical protein